MNKQLEWVLTLLIKLVRCRFYGRVQLSFEAGRLTSFKQEETLKPPPLEV
jgi:hypothetical protein